VRLWKWVVVREEELLRWLDEVAEATYACNRLSRRVGDDLDVESIRKSLLCVTKWIIRSLDGDA
jgi:hypothetical protein